MFVLGKNVPVAEGEIIKRGGVIDKIQLQATAEERGEPCTMVIGDGCLQIKEGKSFITCTTDIQVAYDTEVTKLQVVFISKHTMLVELVYGRVIFTVEDEGKLIHVIVSREPKGVITYQTTESISRQLIDTQRVWDVAHITLATMYGYSTKATLDDGYFYNCLFALEVYTIFGKGEKVMPTLTYKVKAHPILGNDEYVFLDNRVVMEAERVRLEAERAERLKEVEIYRQQEEEARRKKREEAERIELEKEQRKQERLMKKQNKGKTPVIDYDEEEEDPFAEENELFGSAGSDVDGLESYGDDENPFGLDSDDDDSQDDGQDDDEPVEVQAGSHLDRLRQQMSGRKVL